MNARIIRTRDENNFKYIIIMDYQSISLRVRQSFSSHSDQTDGLN